MNIHPSDLVIPWGVTVVEWADYTIPVFIDMGVLPETLLSPDDWQDWAAHVLMYPQISEFNPPSPYAYQDWREWAERFNQVLSAG